MVQYKKLYGVIGLYPNYVRADPVNENYSHIPITNIQINKSEPVLDKNSTIIGELYYLIVLLRYKTS